MFFLWRDIAGETKDHGVALHVDDVAWAKQQMWAPDANEKNGTITYFFQQKIIRAFLE